MATDDPVEPRVSALEGQARAVRSRLDIHDRQIADLHTLASGTDRDASAIMAKLTAHERSIQSLHEDVRDLAHSTATRFDSVDGRMNGLEIEMRTGFAMMAAGFGAISDQLDRITPDD